MKFYVKSKNVRELSPKNFNIVDITKRKINNIIIIQII